MNTLQAFLSEFFGTGLLILLGNALVANVVLKGTKGYNSSWLTITLGWGFAVFFAVMVAGLSLGQLNPAVTLAMIIIKSIKDPEVLANFKYEYVPLYLIGQILGATIGQLIVYAIYFPHYKITDDTNAILATHSTIPAIRSTFSNLVSEIVGTFILIMVALSSIYLTIMVDFIIPGALIAGLTVFIIGTCLGGTTGFAINPVRDLVPRVMHAIVPLPNKGDSQWDYSWIPVVGPLLGASLAGLLICWLAT